MGEGRDAIQKGDFWEVVEENGGDLIPSQLQFPPPID